MQLVTALLCDYATVRENLLHVLGGGITRLWRPDLPAALAVSLALVLDVHPNEAGTPCELRLLLEGPGREIVVDATTGIQLEIGAHPLEAGEGFLVPLALPLHSVGVSRYGKHEARIVVDNAELGSVAFWVLHPDEQTLPPLS